MAPAVRGGAVVDISSSRGVDDIEESSVWEIAADAAIGVDTADKILRLPLCDEDEQALAVVDSLGRRTKHLADPTADVDALVAETVASP